MLIILVYASHNSHYKDLFLAFEGQAGSSFTLETYQQTILKHGLEVSSRLKAFHNEYHTLINTEQTLGLGQNMRRKYPQNARQIILTVRIHQMQMTLTRVPPSYTRHAVDIQFSHARKKRKAQQLHKNHSTIHASIIIISLYQQNRLIPFCCTD